MTAAPPLTETFLIARSAMDAYAMDSPSGEKTGLDGVGVCCVPAMGLASRSDIDLKYSWLFPTYASLVLSGEMASKLLPVNC